MATLPRPGGKSWHGRWPGGFYGSVAETFYENGQNMEMSMGKSSRNGLIMGYILICSRFNQSDITVALSFVKLCGDFCVGFKISPTTWDVSLLL